MITVIAIVAALVLGINAVGITILWAIKSVKEHMRQKDRRGEEDKVL